MATSKLWLGGAIDLQLSGSFRLEATYMGMTSRDTADANSPLGIGGFIEARVSPYITLGFAPRVLLGVKPENSDDSGTEYDLRARLRIGNMVAPRINLHGIVTGGYSMIRGVFSVFDQTTGLRDHYFNPSGLIFAAGIGVAYTINPRLLFIGELSYQFGWQHGEELGVDVEASSKFLTLGGAIATALD